MPAPNRYKRGDVVYAIGAKAILGDIVSVEEPEHPEEEQIVRVSWRAVGTTESADDLELAS